eukprot:scaffold100881_cov28-Tisochrysis_lutea.AAC.7
MWTSPCFRAADAEAGIAKRQKACRARLSDSKRPRRCCLNLAPCRWNLIPPGATSPKIARASATSTSVA